jgi:growth factor-regulated tyrosine kinase substrate
MPQRLFEMSVTCDSARIGLRHFLLGFVGIGLKTVVRYYDQMLEERMANAYTSSRYGAQQQRSSMYSNIPNPDHSGGMESYYSGNAPQMDSYAPQSGYSGYPSAAQAPYPSQEQARISSYGAPPPEASYYQQKQQQQPQQPSYAQPQAPYGQSEQQQPSLQRRQSSNQYPQTLARSASSQYAPSHTSQTSQTGVVASPPPVTDPAANFYNNPSQAGVLPPASPEMYNQLPPQQQPYQHQQQHAAAPPSHQYPQQQQQQYYNQQPPLQTGGAWPQASGVTHAGYGQESFPSAPSHALPVQQPVKEESLIEL